MSQSGVRLNAQKSLDQHIAYIHSAISLRLGRHITDCLREGGWCKNGNIQLTLVISISLISITAYLEAKIWSLLKHESLTTGNKILWKRGEIAPQELLFSTIFSPLFHNIFNTFLTSGVKLHTYLLNVVVRFIFS